MDSFRVYHLRIGDRFVCGHLDFGAERMAWQTRNLAYTVVCGAMD